MAVRELQQITKTEKIRIFRESQYMIVNILLVLTVAIYLQFKCHHL